MGDRHLVNGIARENGVAVGSAVRDVDRLGKGVVFEPRQLGKLLGKTYAPAVIGVCDDGFAREIDAAMASRNNDTERKFPPRGNR